MKLWQDLTLNRTPNGIRRYEALVVHWWDDPAKRPTMQGVINWFHNPASEVSAHYVVSGDDVANLVPETDAAWHAMAANSYTIGIEVDPNTPGNTYRTAGELVKAIRSRRGDLPLRPHHYYVPGTRCPGTIDLNKIEQYAQGNYMNSEEINRRFDAVNKRFNDVPTKAQLTEAFEHLVAAGKRIDAVEKKIEEISKYKDDGSVVKALRDLATALTNK